MSSVFEIWLLQKFSPFAVLGEAVSEEDNV